MIKISDDIPIQTCSVSRHLNIVAGDQSVSIRSAVLVGFREKVR